LIELRKSAIEAFIRCPFSYYALYYKKLVPFKPNVPMQVGGEFHEFAGYFFKLIDYSKLRKMKIEEEVKKYFMSLIPKDCPKLVKPLCVNFATFEARHWMKLQEWTDDPLGYFIPVATELELSTTDIVPGVHNTGHIDRIDRMFEKGFCCVEYKTGHTYTNLKKSSKRQTLNNLRRELSYYVLLARANGFPIDWIALYNPIDNSHFVEPVKESVLRIVRRRILQIQFAHEINFFPKHPSSQCASCIVLPICAKSDDFKEVKE